MVFYILSFFLLIAQLGQAEDTPPQDPGTEVVIQVKAKRRKIQKNSASSTTTLTGSQIARLPQGQEISLPKLMTSTTPGVVQGTFGQMFFRGNHANIQYQLDGVQMPDSPSGSYGQSISPRNIDRMEIITGGPNAEYGQRLSAIVKMESKSGPENAGGEVEANYGTYNTFTPHLLYGGSNESGNLHYFFSLNYNRTDRGLDTPQPISATDQTQGGWDSAHGVAHGDSEFAKVDWLPDNVNKVSVMLSHTQSYFQIPNFPSSFTPQNSLFQPGFQDIFGNTKGANEPLYNYLPSDTNDTQSETNAHGQVIWKHTFNDRSYLQLAPYFKYSLINVGNDPTNDLYFKTLFPNLDLTSFSMNRATNNLGLRGDYTFRIDSQHLAKTGFQLQASRADGPVSFQTDINQSAYVSSTPNLGYFESLYLQDEYTITSSLTLNAGLRFDATQFIYPGAATTTDYLFQPRIGLSYMPVDTTHFHVFYGKLFQPAPIESLRVTYSNVGGFTQLQAYDIQAEKDDYYEAGFTQQIFDQHLIKFNLYYRNGVNVIDDDQLLNTSIAQPYNYQTGYAYGAELSLSGQITSEWSDFVNYSYGIARGKNRTGGVLNGVETTSGYQFMDHVQLHTANAGVSFTHDRFWWSALALFGSGLRTGPNNSIELPSHFSWDTSVGYQIVRPHGNWDGMKASFDLLNVFDNRYPITIANGFNGSHYAAGRMIYLRFSVGL